MSSEKAAEDFKSRVSTTRPGGVVTLLEPPSHINIVPTVSDKFAELHPICSVGLLDSVPGFAA